MFDEQAVADGSLERKLKPEAGIVVALDGAVDFVRLVNTQNGWGFGKLWLKKHRIVVPFVGLVEELYTGADIHLEGLWVQHAKFGWQVKAQLVEVVLPEDGAGVIAWLCHRMPDVGPLRAERLVQRFPPPELWRILEEEPERAAEVEGIGSVVAGSIADSYRLWKFEREQFTALAEFKLKPEQIRAAVQTWGAMACKTIEANPYALQELDGIGFKEADAIARRNGVKKIDPRRIVAGFGEATRLSERDGHTCRGRKKLCSIASSADVLNLGPQRVLPLFDAAVEAGVIVSGSAGIYRPATFAAEDTIAECISALLDPEGANR
jgi:exodeoxyribonuclease V alpha subunit